jgi:hypothetical protein
MKAVTSASFALALILASLGDAKDIGQRRIHDKERLADLKDNVTIC